MNYKDIASRITGISIPVFGISWNPPESERSVAKRVITFLEDKRVLYSPSHLEVPRHCIESILQIRSLLTDEIAKVKDTSELSKSFRAMRAACRKFQGRIEKFEDELQDRAIGNAGSYSAWIFLSAIGEMRASFGIEIAKIAVSYGIDVEKDLADILPAKDE